VKLRLLMLVGLLLCLAGCGDTPTIIEAPPTATPFVVPSLTPERAVPISSVQIGTALSGSGQSVSIVGATTSFTPSSTFAFVVHLNIAGNSPEGVAVITDSLGDQVYQVHIPLHLTDAVVAASFGPIGKLWEEPPLPTVPTTLPAGTYTLSLFLYPPPLIIDYANKTPFTYMP
jgi:hypothetical protein